MKTLLHLAERISTYAVWVCGCLMLLTAFMIGLEVILRKFFTVSMGGADELSSYALAICSSWAFGFALFKKGHVRVDVLYIRLPDILKRFLDILSLVLFLIYMVVLTYFAFLVLKTSILRGSTANTPLQTPLWIPQGLWFSGLLAFTVIIGLILVGSLYFLFTKNYAAAAALSGVTTTDDEIEAETARGRTTS